MKSMSHATQWRLVRLGDLFTQRKHRGSAGLPVLSVTMDRGIVARDSMDRKMGSSLPPEESLLVQPGDLVYNTMRMWQGAVGYSDREGVVSPAYVVCRPRTDMVDGQFMNWLFKSQSGKNKLRSFSHGLTEDRLRLYFDDFAEIPVRLPSLNEQRKIAKIIDTWSSALQSLDRLIAAKECRLKGLMSRLLTKESSGSKKTKWPTARLDTLFEEVTRSIQSNTTRSLSITAAGGFIDRTERFSDKDAGRVLDHYTLLHRGEFAYNKGNSLEYPCGCIYRLESFQEGAVPGVWICFRLKQAGQSPLFYKHFFLARGLDRQLQRRINYGIRNNGLLNLTPEDFWSVRIPVPPLSEQKQLGELFEGADAELRLLRQQHAALVTQKSGLMETLLTGKKSVCV